MSIIRLSSPLILWSFLCLDSLSFLLFFCSLLLVSAVCGCMHYPAKQSLVCLQCSQLASQAVGLPPLSARRCRRMAWRGCGGVIAAPTDGLEREHGVCNALLRRRRRLPREEGLRLETVIYTNGLEARWLFVLQIISGRGRYCKKISMDFDGNLHSFVNN